jgi:hypothetical protein
MIDSILEYSTLEAGSLLGYFAVTVQFVKGEEFAGRYSPVSC